MKILVDESLLSYGLAGVYSGFTMSRHNTNLMSTFDTFDMVNPDLYIANANQINETVLKNIEERPALRLCVVEKNGSTDTENPLYTKLQQRLGNSYSWIIDNGCADIVSFGKAKFNPRYKSDIVYIEDSVLPDIEKVIVPDEYIFRIFSASLINHINYCGFLEHNDRKNAYKSSRFSICSPDSIYNAIICDSYPISVDSDIVELMSIDRTNELKELKEKVLSSLTNFHVLIDILNSLGLDSESKIVANKMKELL